MKLPTYNILKYWLVLLVIFLFTDLLVNIPILTSEQNALAGKVNKDIADTPLSPQEEADLIDHIDELESLDLMQNLDMLKNMDIIEKIDTGESTKKG